MASNAVAVGAASGGAGSGDSLLFASNGQAQVVRWNFHEWRFGSYEKRRPYQVAGVSGSVRGVQRLILITKGFDLGPLHVFSTRSEPEPKLLPLGTNTVHVGDILYDPATKRELWRVLAVEKQHEFDDDTVRGGVLIRSSINGGEEWVPREKLGKVLVGR